MNDSNGQNIVSNTICCLLSELQLSLFLRQSMLHRGGEDDKNCSGMSVRHVKDKQSYSTFRHFLEQIVKFFCRRIPV